MTRAASRLDVEVGLEREGLDRLATILDDSDALLVTVGPHIFEFDKASGRSVLVRAVADHVRRATIGHATGSCPFCPRGSTR